jgi:hypothetical protein
MQMRMHNDNPEHSMHLESVICHLVMNQHQQTQCLQLFSLVVSSSMISLSRMMLLTGQSRGLGMAVTKG